MPVGAGWNEQCLVAWRADCERRKLSRDTITGYDSSLRYFLDWLAIRRMSVLDVGARELLEYLEELRADERKLKMGSIVSRFSGINSLYDYLSSEGMIAGNFVPNFRHRYLRRELLEYDKKRVEKQMHLSLSQIRKFIRSLSDAQDRAIVLLAAKTGIRKGELIAIDIADIDWKSQMIRLKPHPKRTHLWVIFDEETARVLRKWIQIRAHWMVDPSGPLFLGKHNERLSTYAVGHRMADAGRRVGLHKDRGEKHEQLTLHVFRHWFTNTLRVAGMPKHYIQVLRGDSLRETIDVYTYIDLKVIRKEYLKRMPQLILGSGRTSPKESDRERLTGNASFGELTQREAAQPRSRQPREHILALRRVIAHDLQRGRLQRATYYAGKLAVERGMTLSRARPIVSAQLRALGVPPLNAFPHSKKGWRAAQKELQAHFTGKAKKRGEREKRGRV